MIRGWRKPFFPQALAGLGMLFSLLPLSCARAPGPGADRPSFILVSIDTARRDSFGCYGYDRNTTPRIDALASKGVIFDQAVTLSCNTLISHATMLTGLDPLAHGATFEDGGVPIRESYTTLAEDFARAGYQTAAFTAHGDWLNERFGFHQGFQVFESGYRPADEVLASARHWLARRNPGRPFFLFVHLFDVHSDFKGAPYHSPTPFHGRYTGGYRGPLDPWDERAVQGSAFLAAVRDGKIDVTPEDVQYLKGLYDEGLAYTDDRLGRFLESVQRIPKVYLWIVADHGEEFREHGGMLHGSSYDEIIRIPSILVPLEGCRETLGAPRRVAEQVRTLDLRPTLLALAGLAAPRDCQGANLLPWLQGEEKTCPAGPAFLQSDHAIRYLGFKYIKGAKPRLYDLRRDPGERKNLMRDEDAARYAARMEKLLKEQARKDRAVRARHVEGKAAPVEPAPGSEERLRRLGYTR